MCMRVLTRGQRHGMVKEAREEGREEGVCVVPFHIVVPTAIYPTIESNATAAHDMQKCEGRCVNAHS